MSSHSTLSTLAGVRVLVLDDDADTAALFRILLELEHAEVMVASAVAEALEVISWFDPDLIVSDIMMPEADGNAFIRILRDQGNETPAIAVSSAVYPQDQQTALQAGYQCFLTKPFDLDTLVSTVRELLCSREGQETSPHIN